MKRILAVLLSLVLMMGILPVTAMAADVIDSGKCGEELTWKLTDDGVLTISGKGEMYDNLTPWESYYREITSVIIGEGVTSIGNNAFAYLENITSVSISNSVTHIGESAFECCVGLTSAKLPDSLISIGRYAFFECYDLTECDVPESVIYIGRHAFLMTGIDMTSRNSGKCGENLTWNMDEDGVLTISGEGAMYDYDLENTPWVENEWKAFELVIGKGVTEINIKAFANLENCDKVTVDEENPSYTTDENGNLYNKDKTELVKVGNLHITKYTVQNDVKTIGEYSFSNCQALHITIPASVTKIEENAFYRSDYVKAFIVDEGNMNFSSEDGALYNKDKTELITTPRYDEVTINIPSTVERIAPNAFSDGDQYIIKFTGDAPEGLINTEEWVTILSYYPENNPTWTEEAMMELCSNAVWLPYDASTPDAPLPDLSGECGDDLIWTLAKDGTLTISGTGATWEYSNFPEYVQRKIETIVFDEGVTSISDGSFCDLSSVRKIEISSTVSEIGYQVFWSLGQLEAFEVDEDNKYFSNDEYGVLYNKDKTVLIQSPLRTEAEFTVPDGVTTIKGHAFRENQELVRINVPASVSSIDPWAFLWSYRLQEIVVDNENPYYCNDEYGVLFSKDMTKLISIPWGKEGNYTVPASVKYIGERAIPDWINALRFVGDAPEIESYVLYNSEATIYYPENNPTWTEEYMQENGGHMVTWESYDPERDELDITGTCGDDLTWTLTFDGELTISGKGDMWDFDEESENPWDPNYEDDPEWREYGNQITSVTIGEGVTSIGKSAFAELNYYTKVTIPGNVKEIGELAFAYCFGLVDVTIENGVETIGEGAFWNDFYIESITIPASVTEIGMVAFGNSGISEIIVDEDNQNYSSDEAGVLFNKDKTELCVMPAGMTGHYNIPESITVVAEAAFDSTGLTSVTVPASVVEIDVLGLCSGFDMEKILVDENNPFFSSADGVLFNKDKSELLLIPLGITSYTVPESVNYVWEIAINGEVIEELRFVGDAPEFEEGTFDWSFMTVYYPANNSTWNDVISKDYEVSDITWIPYTPSTRPQGDVDGSGSVSNADLILTARYIVKLCDAETAAEVERYGDLNGDGMVTNSDLVMIARIIVS